jgi:hypothetical protein
MKLDDLTKYASGLKSLFAALLLTTAVTLAPVTKAQAQDAAAAVTDMQGAERIELTARVRAISQRVAAASCYSHAGIDTDAFNAIATDGLAEFATLIAALEKGDPNLGLTRAEEARKVLAGIRGINLQWAPFNAAAMTILDGSAPDEGWAFVARQNLNLMHSSKYLVAELVAEYANPPELLQSHALTLDIAARQMALSQQMAKELCGISSANTVLGKKERLKNAARLFDASLNALRNGLDAAGVISPPTPEIKAALEAVTADWENVKAEIATVVEAGSVDAAVSLELFKKLDAIYATFKDVTSQYVKASKFGI